MIIEKLIIKKLYGYIDKTINFNSDITLLVGINGSGKTSVLNIVNWLISPSLADLCVTEFEELSLTFKLNKKKYEIFCDHIDSQFRYQIFTKGKKYNPLVVDLNLNPREIRNDDALRSNLHNYYKSLGPDKEEKETWDLIGNFPNPTIIGLDRHIYTEETPDLIYYDNSIKERSIRNRSRKVNSPLERVKEIVNKEYRKRKNAILNLTNGLKNQLMLSTFDGSITRKSFISGTRYKLNYNQIDQAEIRVREYFSKFEKNSITDDERKTIKEYFSKLKNIIEEYQKDPEDEITKLLYALNAHQFIKVRNLLKEFEQFEKKSNGQMQQVQDFLDTLNHFLKDSAKKILFKEDTSELTFNTLDKDGNSITEYKDISYLSSGEQQILILFSYIAFNSQDGKIFIIDEPELSLHIKWQEDFLEKLEKITPKSTQLILATHSPILANKKKSKSIVLLPYNNQIMNDGFPHLTDSFLAGQDVFYAQFNSINFYVEDQDQENFYYNVLKKLFPDIDFDKIFPLNGKRNVIENAEQNRGVQSNVYILDLDFDEILNKKVEEDNIFYLQKYSIENYLISKTSIYEIIRERNPKLKNEEIKELFCIETYMKNCRILLKDLSCTFIIIQQQELGKEYFRINPSRDFDFSFTPPKIKNNFIDNYYNEVEDTLKTKDARFSLNAQRKKHRRYFSNDQISLKNIPGKYLLSLLKYELDNKKIINQVSSESFNYKLSKDLESEKLNFLKEEIEAYLND